MTFKFSKSEDWHGIPTRMISWGVLTISLIFLIYTMYVRVDSFLDSDMASELILAKHLSEQGVLVSSQYFYSTELRIFNTELVFAPLFSLFSNWHSVRIIGSVISYSVLLASLYYFCGSVGLKKEFPIVGTMLLLPLSYEYFYQTLAGLFYLPYLVLAFLVLGAALRLIALETTNVRFWITTSILLLFSFLGGLQGLRELQLLSGPLFLAFLVFNLTTSPERKSPKSAFIAVCFATIVAGAGCLINSSIFHELFSFRSYGETLWQEPTANGVASFFSNLLGILGYRVSVPLFSIESLFNLCLLFTASFLAFLFVQILRRERDVAPTYLFAIWTVSSLCTFLFIYIFLDMKLGEKYFIPIAAFFLPLAVLALKSKKIVNNKVRKIASAFLTIFIIGMSLMTYVPIYQENPNKEIEEVSKFLASQNLNVGYASFWNGNVLTELTNGKIEVYCWGVSSAAKGSELISLDQRFNWNQVKSHSEPIDEGVNAFFLFQRNELTRENEGIGRLLLESAKPSYDSGNYVIYEYDYVKSVLNNHGDD